MKTENFILAHSFIDSNSVFLNGKGIELKSMSKNFSEKSVALYKHLDLNYPKFFKMDNLSKLGFLGAELLFTDITISKKYAPEEVGVVLSNNSSSLDTDLKFNALISDQSNYFPSPSLFVYTLPNIVAGEICIRHGLKGENAFFISEEFDANLLYIYVNSILDNDKNKACIVGWINLLNENYESFLIFVERKSIDLQSAGEKSFSSINLRNFYNSFHGANH